MMLSFRKRSIDPDAARPSLLATYSFYIKGLLLSLVLGFLFLFRVWAEKGEAVPSAPAASASVPSFVATPSRSLQRNPAKKGAVSSTKINLNIAPAALLETLPGIGPKLAAEFIRYRNEQGPFHRSEDLLQVKGIGPKKLSRIEPYLLFQPNDVEARK